MLQDIRNLGSQNLNCLSKTICFISSCGAAYMAIRVSTFMAHASIALFNKYDTRCNSITESPFCAVKFTGGLVAGILAITVMVGVLYFNNSSQNKHLPIRNPSIIPSGPPQAQPNAFFQPQQNGGFARYAEDDLQGTHRRPLGNYDPVQWDSGSKSI